MKRISTCGLLAVLSGIAAVLLPSAQSAAYDCSGEEADGLVVSLAARGDAYELGNEVELMVRLTNCGSEPAVMHSHADVWHGGVRILVSREDSPFEEYVGPRWGLKDSGHPEYLELAPGAFHEAEITLLHNYRIRTEHLSPTVAQRLTQGRLTADYAFPSAGRYLLKAVLYDPAFAGSVSSEPIEIFVREPLGEDAEVWKAMSANPAYGYFMQTGRTRGNPRGAEARQLVQELRVLTMMYPASRLARRIGARLADYGFESTE